MRQLVLVTAVLTLTSACQPLAVRRAVGEREHFVPAEQETLGVMLDKAPVIVVGRVLAAMAAGGSRIWAGDLELQPMEMTLDGVVCLRGCAGTKTLIVRYYAGNAVVTKDDARFAPTPGQWRVLFLDWKSGILRTRCNTLGCTYVLPGRPSGEVRLPGEEETAGEFLARQMLNVNEEAGEAQASLQMSLQLGHVVSLVGERQTVLILRSIVKNGTERVRKAACMTLAAGFPGQDECLSDLARPGGDAGVSADRLAGLVAMNRARDVQMLDRLRRLASRQSGSGLTEPDSQLSCGEIAMLLLHRDLAIRRAALEANVAICR